MSLIDIKILSLCFPALFQSVGGLPGQKLMEALQTFVALKESLAQDHRKSPKCGTFVR